MCPKFNTEFRQFLDALKLEFQEGGRAVDVLATIYEFVVENHANFDSVWGNYRRFDPALPRETVIEQSRRDRFDPRALKFNAQCFQQMLEQEHSDGLSSCVWILQLMYGLEEAVADAFPEIESADRVGPLKATSRHHNKDYWVVRQSRFTPEPHSLNRSRWLNHLDILPTRLNGVNLDFYRLPNHFFNKIKHGGIENEDEPSPPLRMAVWPVSRELTFNPSNCGEHDGLDRKEGIFRLKPRFDIGKWIGIFKAKILPACRIHEVNMLLIPELTGSQEFTKELRKVLLNNPGDYPWLIVCGSYHENTDDFHNQAHVITGDGQIMCLQRGTSSLKTEWLVKKCNRFSILQSSFSEGCPKEYEFCCEPHSVGNSFHVVETPLGRVWVTICLDFLKAVPSTNNETYIGLADWVLVPAATPSTREFDNESMTRANSVGGVTVVGNACWLLEKFKAWNKGEVRLCRAPWRDQKLEWLWLGSNDNPFAGSDASPCELKCEECLWILAVFSPGTNEPEADL